MDLLRIAKKYALVNAVLHNGKANPDAVIKKIVIENPAIRNDLKDPEKRNFIKETILKVVSEINRLSIEDQEKILKKEFNLSVEELLEAKSKKTRVGLPPLPDADKYTKIVTRFAPAPSGALHIGQFLRAAYLSYIYARKYNGEFVLRVEDTDPKRIKKIYYKWIQEDLKAMGLHWDKLVYESDHFDLYYKLARELFLKGRAYICTCSTEEFSKYKEQKKSCPHREKLDKVEDWDKLVNGEYQFRSAVIRLKTDMKHINPALRDPPIMRLIKNVPHPRTGYKYTLYALYNFACVIEDHMLNITHVIRAKEHQTNEDIQKEIYQAFGWQLPTFIEYGMIKLPGMKIHKRYIRNALRQGDLSGWEDIRLPTLRALLRRGIHPEALKKLAEHVGMTKNDIEVSLETLYTFNRQILSPIAKRISFVKEPYRIIISEIEEPIEVKMDWIPGNPKAGKRYYRLLPVEENGKKSIEVFISKDDLSVIHNAMKSEDIIRLKELGNIQVINISEQEKTIEAKLHSRKVIPGISKIHWVPGEDLYIPAIVNMPDGSKIKGLIELEAQKLEKGDYIQMERFGFGRIDANEGEIIIIAYAHP
ncbi:MAG: glutamate--tRNA ligase [Candidatus Njordarchaeum guaymaensis]